MKRNIRVFLCCYLLCLCSAVHADELDDAIELIASDVAQKQSRHLTPVAQAFSDRSWDLDYLKDMGRTFGTRGEWDLCCSYYRASLNIAPTDPEVRANLALALLYRSVPAPEEALSLLRPTLKEAKTHDFLADVHNTMGIALRQLNADQEAIAEFQLSLQFVARAEVEGNLSETYFHLGQIEEALIHAKRATTMEPHSTTAFFRLGTQLRAAGKGGDAISAYRRASALDSSSDEILEELAELEWETGRWKDAEHSLRALLFRKPHRPVQRALLGSTLQHQGRFLEAKAEFDESLRLDPDYALAWRFLGIWYEERGELESAGTAFRKARASDPSHAMGLTDLAKLLKATLPEEELTALENLVSRTAGNRSYQRANQLFALAQVMDARGEIQKIAPLLLEAHSIRGHAIQTAGQYQPDKHVRFIDQIIETFDAAFFERLEKAPIRGARNSRRPVFVIGLPRSGTTLLEQILASHSQIHGAGELSLAEKTFFSLSDLAGKQQRVFDFIRNITPERLETLADTYLSWLDTINSEKVYIVDKMPENYMYLGLLAAMFPDAIFINARRDLRDIALSVWITEFRTQVWTHEPSHIVSRFEQYLRIMDHWHSVLPSSSIHDWDYETVVTQGAAPMRKLVEETLGLRWEPQCAEFYQTKRTVQTASVLQVRKPLYRSSLGRWQRYEKEMPEIFGPLRCSGIITRLAQRYPLPDSEIVDPTRIERATSTMPL